MKQIIDYKIKSMPLKITKFKGFAERIESPPHFHIYEIEIQFIKEGNGYYFIKNKKYKVESRKVFIIHKKDIHYFIKPEINTEMEKITIMMKKDVLEENAKLFDKVFKCDNLHQIHLNENDFLISVLLLEEILENMEKVDKLKKFKTLLKLNISKFFFILNTNIENLKLRKETEMDFRIEKAIEFIEKNYNKKITEDEICREIGLSKYYFSHLFKKITGISFKEYLIEKRLFESEKLLEISDLKLEKIAVKCGFSNLSLFLKEFKKRFKVTPTQFRKLKQKII
ncbi:MAG: AraC family transcriptional regulator [Candidatus Omnitrophica bacterium]|nr:AraC family transcriptional regulator [Candidatus Omnitrophota bacterium]